MAEGTVNEIKSASAFEKYDTDRYKYTKSEVNSDFARDFARANVDVRKEVIKGMSLEAKRELISKLHSINLLEEKKPELIVRSEGALLDLDEVPRTFTEKFIMMNPQQRREEVIKLTERQLNKLDTHLKIRALAIGGSAKEIGRTRSMLKAEFLPAKRVYNSERYEWEMCKHMRYEKVQKPGQPVSVVLYPYGCKSVKK